MAPTAEKMAKLDADIAEAWTKVLAARIAWSRSANADSVTAEEIAQQRLDKLLEFRYAVTHDKVTAG